MPNQIILKNSSVVGKIPQLADLEYGEIALNYADGKIYYKTNTNQIGTIGTSTGGGGGGSAVSAGDNPPASPQDNDLWWNTETGVLNIYYNDGTSSQWVSVGGEPGADGLGVPAGGTTGQALIKNSSLDNDARWGTVVEVTDAVTAGQFDRTNTTPSSTQRLNYNGNLHATNVIAGSFTGTVAASNITATGTKDATTFLRGDNSWVVPPGAVSMKITRFTTGSGTFIRDPKTLYAQVLVVGGGGGGGGATGGATNIVPAGGGGGGGTCIEWYTAATLGSTASYSVGAGGSAGAGGNGGAGGSSTFTPSGAGTAITGGGGGGGLGGTGSNASFLGGSGGTTTAAADINTLGQNGEAGFSARAEVGSAIIRSGAGGASSIGFGAIGQVVTAAGSAVGLSGAANSGAGGSGACLYLSTTARNGGAGGSGLIVVTEYLSA